MIATSVLLLTLTTIVSANDVQGFAQVGGRVTGQMKDGVAVTRGVIRVRRRHENDMDFSKYNPFYWEGRLTRYRIEDFTSNGEKKIRFTLLTEWPQDSTKYRGVDFSAIYTGDPLAHETKRSKFAINVRMKHVAEFRHFEYTLNENAFRIHAKELKQGELLTLEFRFFNTESHESWQKQKKRNHHNLSAYYSEFIRIRIGQPGVYIDNLQTPNAFPSPRRYTGGWTTIPTVRVEPWRALQQQAFNLTWGKGANFLMGRTWFHTDFKSGAHNSDRSDDKPSVFFSAMKEARKGFAGSLYNVTSCNACHNLNGTSLLPSPGKPIHTTVVKTMDPKTGSPHSRYSVQLQTDGPDREGELIIARFETKRVKLADGEVVTLSKPIFAVRNDDTVALSPRRTPAIIGMGLLEAVPDETILALAKSSKGKANEISHKRLGRFGWKASQPTVVAQIKDALRNDMGVLTSRRQRLDSANASSGKGWLDHKALDQLETYVALLGVPPRINPNDPGVLSGEKVFHRLNCHTCHAPTLRTGKSHHRELTNQTIHPYTDLLLHDMGEGLADGDPTSKSRLWRTAPLWGLKNTRDANNDFRDRFRPGDTNVTYEQTHAAARKNPVQLLHDGRARSIAEAILWHGGEATGSVELYKKLPNADRQRLEDFLWDL